MAESIAERVLPDSIDTDRKVGPLTTGTWVLLVLGGVLVGITWRFVLPRFGRGAPASSEPVVEVVDEQPDDLDGAVVSTNTATPPWFPASGSLLPATPGDYSTPQQPVNRQPTTNQEWARMALDELVIDGVSPTAANEALSRYISGLGLDIAQRAMVDRAIRKLGAPPEPVPSQPIEQPPTPTPIVTTPTPTPAPPPVAVVTTPATRAPAPVETAPPPTPPAAPPAPSFPRHTIAAGDTLWALVRRHYGRVNTAMVDAVAAHNGLRWNAAHTVVSPWRVGQVIEFPNL